MFKIWRSPSISGAYALRRVRSAASTAEEVVVEKPIVYKGRGKYVYFVRPNGLQTARREREDRSAQHQGGAQDGRSYGLGEQAAAALIAEQRGGVGR